MNKHEYMYKHLKEMVQNYYLSNINIEGILRGMNHP